MTHRTERTTIINIFSVIIYGCEIERKIRFDVTHVFCTVSLMSWILIVMECHVIIIIYAFLYIHWFIFINFDCFFGCCFFLLHYSFFVRLLSSITVCPLNTSVVWLVWNLNRFFNEEKERVKTSIRSIDRSTVTVHNGLYVTYVEFIDCKKKFHIHKLCVYKHMHACIHGHLITIKKSWPVFYCTDKSNTFDT